MVVEGGGGEQEGEEEEEEEEGKEGCSDTKIKQPHTDGWGTKAQHVNFLLIFC